MGLNHRNVSDTLCKSATASKAISQQLQMYRYSLRDSDNKTVALTTKTFAKNRTNRRIDSVTGINEILSVPVVPPSVSCGGKLQPQTVPTGPDDLMKTDTILSFHTAPHTDDIYYSVLLFLSIRSTTTTKEHQLILANSHSSPKTDF